MKYRVYIRTNYMWILGKREYDFSAKGDKEAVKIAQEMVIQKNLNEDTRLSEFDETHLPDEIKSRTSYYFGSLYRIKKKKRVVFDEELREVEMPAALLKK